MTSLKAEHRRAFQGIDIVDGYTRGSPLSFSDDEISDFRSSLLTWYEANRRLLPWRGDQLDGYPTTPDPTAYGTWVSEIMLQQTRVETVISYWFKWMGAFPTVQALSTATPDEVNTLWSGLGNAPLYRYFVSF